MPPPGFEGSKPTVHVCTADSSVLLLKPPLLANMKSTNYLLDALIQMEAEDQGANLAIQVATNGVVAESSVSCVVVVGKDVGGVSVSASVYSTIHHHSAVARFGPSAQGSLSWG